LNASLGRSKIIITMIVIKVEILVFVIFIADEKKERNESRKKR